VKFAKIVFTVAGIVGILQLLPLYFLFDLIGHRAPPVVNHPEFYFGFVGVALAWQAVFLLIGTDPYRYRAVMLLSILEKASYISTLAVLLAQHRIGLSTALPATSDLILGLLFVAAYARTGPATRPALE
jgi:predicted tellurium resistance membrane protein TerC